MRYNLVAYSHHPHIFLGQIPDMALLQTTGIVFVLDMAERGSALAVTVSL